MPDKFSPEELARFDAKVVPEPNTGCWLWSAGVCKGGYGVFWWHGQSYSAHRASYERHISEIPTGLFVCHRCDTRACVNPAHLFVGTASDNTQDAAAKGRMVHGDANGNARLTLGDVERLRSWYVVGASFREIAREFGISDHHAREIVAGTKWGMHPLPARGYTGR